MTMKVAQCQSFGRVHQGECTLTKLLAKNGF